MELKKLKKTQFIRFADDDENFRFMFLTNFVAILSFLRNFRAFKYSLSVNEN